MRPGTYYLHYVGLRRHGFLWLQKDPTWQIRKWVEAWDSCVCHGETMQTCHGQIEAEANLARYQRNSN